MQKAQAKFGSVFEAKSIARDICRGIERGQFQINHGFDGFMLGTMTTGMSPEYHTISAITQVYRYMYMYIHVGRQNSMPVHDVHTCTWSGEQVLSYIYVLYKATIVCKYDFFFWQLEGKIYL